MDWAAMILYIAVTCITPGPNNLMCLYLSVNYGLKGARKFVTASTICFFIKLMLCGGLNVMLAKTVPLVVPYLKWLGALYMFYLAFVMLRSGFSAQQTERERSGGESTYRQGVILQCLNMKSWVCNLSVYSVYVISHTTALGTILTVAVINTVLMLAGTLCWGAFGSIFRRVYNEHREVFGVIFAVSLIWCAVTGLK